MLKKDHINHKLSHCMPEIRSISIEVLCLAMYTA